MASAAGGKKRGVWGWQDLVGVNYDGQLNGSFQLLGVLIVFLSVSVIPWWWPCGECTQVEHSRRHLLLNCAFASLHRFPVPLIAPWELKWNDSEVTMHRETLDEFLPLLIN